MSLINSQNYHEYYPNKYFVSITERGFYYSLTCTNIIESLLIALYCRRTTASKTRQEELRLTRVSMLQQIGKTYFQPGDTKCVALANQVSFHWPSLSGDQID